MSQGIQSFVLPVFLKPMVDELRWSRTQFTGVISIGRLVTGFSAPLFGPIIDRRGAREFMVIGSAITGLGLMALAWTSSLWYFYLVMGLVVSLAELGMSQLTVNVAVSNWFIKKRGRALGLAAMGSSLTGMLITPIVASFIGVWGWRGSWVILGTMVLVVVILPAALLMRR